MDKKVKGLEIEVATKGVEEVKKDIASITEAVDRLSESVERLRELGVTIHIDGIIEPEE